MVDESGSVYFFGGRVKMSEIIEQPRNFCMLGAQHTVCAIERAIPIVHAGPGCSAKLFSGMSFCGGYQGSVYTSGNAIPCSNTGEREVVFGGEDKLRHLIDGALKVMDGDLYVVLTGCTSDIVGDDVRSVVSGFSSKNIPIVYAETGGFKGNSYKGHELVVSEIIKQFVHPTGKTEKGLVNVWSVVPNQDPYWEGNLKEIKYLLQGIGLKANILFGHGSGGVEAWSKIPSAQFNLVLSPWLGLSTAHLLEDKFGTPYIRYPVLPIGGDETSRFLRTIGEFAGIESYKINKFIDSQESNYYHYLERAADFLLEFRYDLPGRFFIASDSFYTLAISKFLVNDFGMLPGKQIITDGVPDNYKDEITDEFKHLAPGISSDVAFTTDGGAVERELLNFEHRYLPLIIGSSWDKDVADELNGYFLSISLPVIDRLILNRTYVGYNGGLRLIEDIYTAVLQKNQL